MNISAFIRYMTKVLAFLFLLNTAIAAEPNKMRFELPKSLPLTVSLVLPKSGAVVAHEKTADGDKIRAQIPDDENAGMLVEISDSKEQRRWRYDFGFNSSRSDGCEIEVSYQPALRLLLVHYYGYKWDHEHKLLFVETGESSPVIREYDAAQKDILPVLKRRKDFPQGFEYSIRPYRFTERGIEFSCIPLQLPERQSVHPFAQDEPWYVVSTTVGPDRKVKPIATKVEKH